MLLAIDSGNTNIVFAIFDGDGMIRGEWRSSTDSNRTADEFGIWLEQLLKLSDISRADVTDAIIATVVPATLYSLKTLCRKYFQCEPLVVGEGEVDLGLDVRIEKPSEAGADRLVNAVSGFETYGGPLIIIDFGTATTFDVIGEDGSYQGGAIAPGINLSMEALHQAAAQLPRVAVTRPTAVIGKNTVDAMLSGTFWGYVGMIEGLVSRIQQEMAVGKARVIATGGLAPLFSEHCDTIEVVDPDLTLRGLLAIHRRNRT
ncbi:MAG: type III pantothenate kinase [Rhodospirillales bacterium]|nr:type III pantothenate kinase [Rhodospirillales bacterium]